MYQTILLSSFRHLNKGLESISSSKVWVGHLKKGQSAINEICNFVEKKNFVGHPVGVAKHFPDIHQRKRCPWDKDGSSAIITFLTTHIIPLDRIQKTKKNNKNILGLK